MPQHSMFNPAIDGHRIRIEVVDHTMSHSGDFRQMGFSLAPLDGDYRTVGLLRYPNNFGSELLAADATQVLDRWMWADTGEVVRYIARQQRHIDKYCSHRLLDRMR